MCAPPCHDTHAVLRSPSRVRQYRERFLTPAELDRIEKASFEDF
jgi:hypothetical protein